MLYFFNFRKKKQTKNKKKITRKNAADADTATAEMN